MIQASWIQTITLPVPWDLKSVNAHLVELEGGLMLVDSGVATDQCFHALESAIHARGAQWTDIRTLLLTHYHPDHIGLSWKILGLTGARLIMHRADVAHLAELARTDGVPYFHETMRIAGVPAEKAVEMEKALKSHRMPFQEHHPQLVLEGGEHLPVRGGTLQVIWTPGHAPGHVCLYSPETRILISGDHVLQKITPNIAWHPKQDMLATYIESLKLLLPYDVAEVRPSHGEPFTGLRAVIESIIEHHDERCGEILDLIKIAPRTAHELVGLLWKRKLSAFHHNFAVFEILAHLEYMKRRGEIVPQAQPDSSLTWNVS
ncbi:MAG TPA: MBL fold metallo-hydrolase [Bryobacteraceae bacterium]|nr:MBL fold metallo-hydrolase [Bryobacteraceae bacterium]